MSTALCFICENSLKRSTDASRPDDWFCQVCSAKDGDNLYYSCSRCESMFGTIELDWSGNQKGMDCQICKRWFCAGCYQHTGELVSHCDLDEVWTCDNCFAGKNSEKVKPSKSKRK